MPLRDDLSSLRKELDAIYTPLEVAKEEIWKRWRNKELKKKVEDFLEGDLPLILEDSPKAFISRHILSPNFELLNFLESVKGINIQPVGLEYIQDKFVTKNKDKYYLGKMVFYDGTGKNGGRKTSSVKIIDFDLCDGKKLCELETVQGKSFVEFHHQLVDLIAPSFHRFDMSEFYKRNGRQAKKYYQYILSLFVCYGVLFENFLLSESYKDLTRDILLPTFGEIYQMFGVKPLITHLVPQENEEDVYWRYYPMSTQEKVSDIMSQML